MGSFQIRTTQPAREIRFADPVPGVLPQPAAVAPAAAPPLAADQANLHRSERSPAPAAELNLFDAAPAPATATAEGFRERLSTRQSQLRVGPEQVQLELGLASEGPEMLTADRDPDLVQSLKARLGSGASEGAAAEQMLRTGARLQPHEAVELQLGVAAAVSSEQLGFNKTQLEALGAVRPGVYAGLGVELPGFSSKIAIDTAQGKPRAEFGTAIQAGETATLGLSVLHQAQTGSTGLRLGTEVKAAQDTVVGVNLNQPLDKTDARNTAFGLYLNTRFR